MKKRGGLCARREWHRKGKSRLSCESPPWTEFVRSRHERRKKNPGLRSPGLRFFRESRSGLSGWSRCGGQCWRTGQRTFSGAFGHHLRHPLNLELGVAAGNAGEFHLLREFERLAAGLVLFLPQTVEFSLECSDLFLRGVDLRGVFCGLIANLLVVGRLLGGFLRFLLFLLGVAFLLAFTGILTRLGLGCLLLFFSLRFLFRDLRDMGALLGLGLLLVREVDDKE